MTLTYLFKRTRHVSPVFVWDLLRLVGGFYGFAKGSFAAVNAFEDDSCFAALAAFSAAADAFAVAGRVADHSIVGKRGSSPVQRY